MTQFGVRPLVEGSKFFPAVPRNVVPRERVTPPPPPKPPVPIVRRADEEWVNPRIVEAIESALRRTTYDNVPGTYLDAAVQPILSEICVKYKVTLNDLRSRRRNAALVAIRHEAMQAIKDGTPLSLVEIGRIFGKDHTTVLHGIRKVEAMRAAAEIKGID